MQICLLVVACNGMNYMYYYFNGNDGNGVGSFGRTFFKVKAAVERRRYDVGQNKSSGEIRVI